jgi:hypothetical protein
MPKGRHCAQLTVRKHVLELLLGREPHLVVANTILKRWKSTHQLAGNTIIMNR